MDLMAAGDVAAHLPSVRRRFVVAEGRCQTHLDEFPAGFVSWSGGKDSTVVVRMASRITPNVPVVFFDSGLEMPENVAYMHDVAEQWGLNFHTIAAEPDALTIMAATGAWDHDAPATTAPGPDLHEALITVPSAKAHAQFGRGNLWGLRGAESDARRALLAGRQGVFTRANGVTVCSPIWDWRDETVWAYLAAHRVPENPVYARLEALGATGKDLRVGLAFDGNNLQHGRVRWLRLGWPELYERVCAALPRVREYR